MCGYDLNITDVKIPQVSVWLVIWPLIQNMPTLLGYLQMYYFNRDFHLSVAYTYLETGYSINHDCLNENLYLHHFQVEKRMTIVVTITMAVILPVIISATIPSCSSFTCHNEGIVKI